MDKNFVKYPFYITSIVIVVLLGLQFVPEKLTGKLGLRQIDILSDIRKDTLAYATHELAPLEPPSPPVEIQEIPCPEGMVCFEDYSKDGTGLNKFFKAFGNRQKKPVRIAFFGDSYIEGDIFCGDLRNYLQKEYGGMGAGLIMPTSHVASFRKTVKHSFGGWNSYCMLDHKDFSRMGISGNYYLPNKNAWVKYSGVKTSNKLEYVRRASLIYLLPEGQASVSYSINGSKDVKNITLKASPKIAKYDITADSIENIKFDFLSGNIYVYGISLQDTAGIVVDNFSLRGSPGTTLKYLPENILKQTDSILNYSLIILQYGLNVMTANNKNYTFYQKGMKETVEHLKKCFPKSDILLLSVGDRSMKKAGNYVTMPAVRPLVASQQAVCSETGIVFWNLFEAMGGDSSMIELVKAKPPKANKDYTHLNFEGGKYLGEILFKTFRFEKDKFDKIGKNRKRKKS